MDICPKHTDTHFKGSKKPVGETSPAVKSVGFSGKMEDIFKDELATRADFGANAVGNRRLKYE